MPRWEDPRGARGDLDRDRWRRREAARYRDEPRTFEPPPARPDPYANDEDAGAAGYERRGRDADRPGYDDEPHYPPGGAADAYPGQEYGVEGRGYDAGEPDPDPGWGLAPGDLERRRNFDLDDPGSGQSQAGYATRSPHEHQFDPDYVRWREEQLRNHDRVYEAWRRRQHQRYDEQYRLSRDRRTDRR